MRRVATEDSPYAEFWANGGDEGYLRRRAQALRWLRRYGRLRGARITRLRAIVKVTGERTKHEAVLDKIGSAEAQVIRQCLTGDLPETTDD